MVLACGAHIGPYEIEAQIGSGGMGDVYRARDPRLGREVAIKVLRAEAGERRRFEAEARAASRLNHPNILAVYDTGEADGAPYIVTELLDGQSLREAIAAGALPVRRMLDIAVQIAAGLAAAHDSGLTHRDLKPENVMLLREGRAKILDFGLAKPAVSEQTGEETRTAEGVISGTLAYMSPEQIQGQEIDYRSDQFSFGVVLYEMATGAHPFRREDRVSTMSAIVRDEPPPIVAAAPSVPAPVRWVIDRCLSKDRAQRYTSTTDLCEQLRDIHDHFSEAISNEMAPKRPLPRGTRWRVALIAFAAVACAAILVGAGAMLALRWATPQPRYTPFATSASDEAEPAWSPDGRVIAYAALDRETIQIFARDLQSSLPAQLTKATSDCRAPFWSPDSSRVYYWSAGKLWSVPAVGGESQEIMPLVGPWPTAAISPDGEKIAYFSRAGQYFGVSFRKLGDRSDIPLVRDPLPRQFRFPGGIRFSRTGRKLLIWLTRDIERGTEAWVVPLPDGAPRRVSPETWRGFRLVHMNWAADDRTVVLSMIATPETLSHLYRLDTETSAIEQLTFGASNESTPAVCPHGDRIVFASGDADSDIFEFSLDGARMRPLVATSRRENSADWSPSGREIAFVSDARGLGEIWMQDVPNGTARPVVEGSREGSLNYGGPRFSPDGQRIAYVRIGTKHVVLINHLSGGTSVPLEQETTDQHAPAWSPDGKWIAYVRYAGGRWEIAKAPAGATGSPVSVAPGGGAYSHTEWSPAGDRICFTEGLSLYCADAGGGTASRVATGISAFMFARDGGSVYTLGRGAVRGWELRNVRFSDGQDKRVEDLDLPAQAQLSAIRMHPDGTRFVTSIAEWKRDLWLLDGWRLPPLWRFLKGS